jgi:hypothetical protein
VSRSDDATISRCEVIALTRRSACRGSVGRRAYLTARPSGCGACFSFAAISLPSSTRHGDALVTPKSDVMVTYAAPVDDILSQGFPINRPASRYRRRQRGARCGRMVPVSRVGHREWPGPVLCLGREHLEHVPLRPDRRLPEIGAIGSSLRPMCSRLLFASAISLPSTTHRCATATPS